MDALLAGAEFREEYARVPACVLAKLVS